MTIQKKSLLNSMKTTKKAIVASAPEAGSVAPATVKPKKTNPSVRLNARYRAVRAL